MTVDVAVVVGVSLRSHRRRSESRQHLSDVATVLLRKGTNPPTLLADETDGRWRRRKGREVTDVGKGGHRCGAVVVAAVVAGVQQREWWRKLIAADCETSQSH